MGNVDDLLVAGGPKSFISIRKGTNNMLAYIKKTSARAHHEPSLVELSSTCRIVVRLAVSQVRPCVGNVDHG